MSRFDETIKTMQDITSEIKKVADDRVIGLDIDTTTKVRTVASKTIDVINEAAVRLKEAVGNIEDETELDCFLDRVEQKCQDAKKYAFEKFNEVASGGNNVEVADFVKIDDVTENLVNKENDLDLKPETENESEPILDPDIELSIDDGDDVANKLEDIINFISSFKDNIIEYVNSPKTKEMISKAKLSALNAADKGLDLLIKVLDGKKKED